MKSRVFKTAWQIASKFKTFAAALNHAWELIKLKKSMLSGVVKFTYKRIDDSIRPAVGTLKEIDTKYAFQGNARTKESMIYFDLEMGAFRSFKIY
ncbi:SH3 beta-barrel fold-containing protein [Pedobacter zeae]|uniref:DUF2693 domain-containing protein n=1 Tax=Pedobacter zeae TaxID=1737356 RepID=A0A7W6KAU6_9SPHI|nr:SH3 beta-barrel fold-containing protein [Pedobacter zeae]MBB4108329.1 hypothetical protein [Pedobacter zeae]GGG93506.1 hypothetical protein GCM10007422_03440 [Pedobacter zeae]